jgi:UDP-2,4-diacetamido-2,4,6-trideoxy-beta-L-altropyranose hydrolase
MKIVFRTDASIQIGTGHVMRCLTLADSLRLRGADCTFICRNHSGHLLELIHQRGHRVQTLAVPETFPDNVDSASLTHETWLGTDWASDAADTALAIGSQILDWLVVDHYSLDARWEKRMRPTCQRLMVIDDLADRPHDADLLLDQNLGRVAGDYTSWVPAHCTVLTGASHALLRPEFAAWRTVSLARRGQPQLDRLLISLGGVDIDNATTHILQALCHSPLPAHCQITVIMGPHAPWLDRVREQASQMPWPTEVLVNVTDMAQWMTHSDLAIGAAGSTNWERCCLGLPCLLLVLAPNQESSARALAHAQAVQVVDHATLAISLPAHIQALKSSDTLAALSSAAQVITDGQGASRLAEWMLQTPPDSRADVPQTLGETC